MVRNDRRTNGVRVIRRDRSQRGFSLLETLIVVAIVVIMGGIALFNYAAARKATAQDASGKQIVDFLRDASERTLASTRVHRVDLTPSTASTVGSITMTRLGATAADTVVVRQETLAAYTEIILDRPASFAAKPPAPFDFADVAYTSGKWSVLFHADGSATNTAAPSPSLISTVIYLYAPKDGNASQPDQPQSIRAISLFGPTGSVRFWGYDGSQFIKR